jgi:hypothetical protein
MQYAAVLNRKRGKLCVGDKWSVRLPVRQHFAQDGPVAGAGREGVHIGLLKPLIDQ